MGAISIDALRQLRKAKGWSQAELGKRAGVAQTQISAFERGIEPTLESGIKICRALGVPLRQLWPKLADLLDSTPSEVAG